MEVDLLLADRAGQIVDEDAPLAREAVEEVGVSPKDLPSTDIETHIYDERAKGVLDRIAGIVGLESSITKLGIIHEASRYKSVRDEEHPRRKEKRYGVSVRLLVAATDWEFKGKLTIPVVAASAELGYRSANIAIQVRGYVGSLGDKLPSPTTLNVESYAEYITSFKAIQDQVFKDEENQRPVLLEERSQSD